MIEGYTNENICLMLGNKVNIRGDSETSMGLLTFTLTSGNRLIGV